MRLLKPSPSLTHPKSKIWNENARRNAVQESFAEAAKRSIFYSPKQAMEEVIKVIKKVADDFNCSNPKEINWYLEKYFSVDNRDKAYELAMLWRKIEAEQFAQYEKDREKIAEDRSSFFDEDIDSEPEIYVKVYSDRLIAVATKPGLAGRLPSGMGKKYIGEPGRLEWRYNLEALEFFKQKNILIFGENNA